ncbi:MAG: ATP-binding cassette domain-containing protein [Raoultibacter sp.]
MDALSFSEVSFTYPDAAAPVLRDLSWTVAAGSFTLLVGATGSGKTTLLRCSKPELAPAGQRRGIIEVFGCAVEGMDARTSATHVGYVAQNPANQIVCDTVWHEMAFGLENLGVSPVMMRRRVAEVAHFFGIGPWFRRDTVSLSGGQKQLLNLASVLVMQPKVLLLDEPTAQLDPVAAKNFLHALFRINRELGITLVVATHSPEMMLDYATGSVCVENGRVRQKESAHTVHPFAAECPYHFSEDDLSPVLSGSPTRDSVLQMLGQGEKQAASPGSLAPSIVEVKDVRFRYARDAQWVLRGASLAVAPGSIHAIVGGNGCGKSTLLRLMAGTLKPERGKVINAAERSQVLVPQNPQALFVCDTVAEELSEWSERCSYTCDDVRVMMDIFGLTPVANQHPFDTSGGQQQKIALVKVLLTRPDLLLLDEPTKGLDAASKLVIAEVLRALAAQGKTVVLVTHDLAFVSCVADVVTMLFDGEVACTDTAPDFFAANIFYRVDPDAFSRLWEQR